MPAPLTMILGAVLSLFSTANDSEAVFANVSSLLFAVLVLFESQSLQPIKSTLKADAAPSWRQVRFNLQKVGIDFMNSNPME